LCHQVLPGWDIAESLIISQGPHAPTSPATREAIVQELIAVAREPPPVKMPEQLSLALN
jgi:hypothetical protein